MSGMEADDEGLPVRCIRCGKDKGEEEAYMHEDCWFGEDGDWESYSNPLALEWDAGARDFPRRTPPACAEVVHRDNKPCKRVDCPLARRTTPGKP